MARNKNKNRNSRPSSRKGMSDDYAVPMDASFKSGLDAFTAAAKEQLGGSFSIYSGSRSPNKQRSLKSKLGKSRPVGSAYGSPHVHGYAADMRYNGKPIAQAPKRVRDWMKANAKQFGLTFDRVPGEPWHVEPIKRGATIAAPAGGLRGLPETMAAPASRPTNLPGFNERALPDINMSSPRFGAAPGNSFAGQEQSFSNPPGLNPNRMGGILAPGNSMAGLETDRPVAPRPDPSRFGRDTGMSMAGTERAFSDRIDPSRFGGRLGVPDSASYAGQETSRPGLGMSMAGTETAPGGLNPSRFGGNPGGIRHENRYDRMSAPPAGDSGLISSAQGGPSPSRFGDSVFGDNDVFDDSGYRAAQDFGSAFGRSAAAQNPNSFSTGTMTDVVSPSAATPRGAVADARPSYAGQETARPSVPGSSFAGQDTAAPYSTAAAPSVPGPLRQASATTPDTLEYTEEDLPAEVRTTGAPTVTVPELETRTVPSLEEDPVSTLEPIDGFPSAPQPPKEPRFAPSTKFGMRVGGLLGGPLGQVAGGLLGSGFGRMMRDLPSYRDQIAAEQFDVGSGLGGIMAAQGGKRGATGTSVSNPGMSVTSLGNGETMRRSNNYGWTEIVGPDGSVTGIQYDDPKSKGLLGKISGGIFSSGGRTRGDRSLSREVSDAIDRGSVGLY
jgi:hypothetical protein